MKLKIKKKRVIITVVLLVLIVAVYTTYTAAANKGKVKSVNTSSAGRKDIVQSVSTTGYIEANQEDNKTLGSTQKVTQVLVKEGQNVKAGDILVKLDTTDLDYQLKKALINKDLSSITTDSSRKQTQLDLKSAAENLSEAQRKYDANKQLYDNGYISLDEFKTYDKALQDAKSRIESLNNQLSNLDANSQSSEQKKQNELSAVEMQNLRAKIKDSIITANVSGKIVKMNIKENQYPQQGSNEISIFDISSLKVNVQLSQYDVVLLKTGQKVSVKPKGVNKTYSGTVSKIGQIAETVSSGTDKETKVDVEITITNPDNEIKVGYEVDAVIVLQEKKNVVSVNYEAVRQDKDGKKYIFVVENNKVVKRTVETGVETDFDVEILKGLNEGEKYIPNPPETLKDGEIVVVSGGTKK